jgi:Big-like domain-containing protein
MARVRNCVVGAAAVATFLIANSCGDSSTGPKQAGPPAQVDIVSGDGQEGTVGKELPKAVVAKVVDGNGIPVPGQSVNFVVTSGGGRVFAGSSISNALGIVQEIWRLGTVAGEAQRLEARAVDNTTGQPIVFAAFTATAVADEASALQMTTQPGTPARSRVVLSTQPVVRLVDRYGNAVRKAGVTVTASVTAGGGTRTLQGTTSVATVANGVATFTNLAILGQVGTLTLAFASTGLTPVTSADVILAAGDPAVITKVSEDGQSASVGSTVASAPSVKVTDADGNLVSGATVTFAVGSGGGQLTGESAITNADGIATVGSWKLGTIAGTNTVTASIGGLSASFTATATPGSAELAILQQPSATARSGEPLAQQPRLRLQDQYGNATRESGITVTALIAAGPEGLTLSGATATTDADGIAAFSSLTLTGGPGTVKLRFVASSTGDRVTAGDILLSAGTPASVTKVAGDDQAAPAGSAVDIHPAVRVLDARGLPIKGARVRFTPATGGGSVTGAEAITDADGRATVGSWTLGPKTGPNTLTATSEGASATFTANGITPVRVEIVSPAFLSTVDDVLNVAARVTSNFGIAAAEADVEGRQATLIKSSDGLWKGTIDLTGMSTGRHVVTVTGTDAQGNSSFSATTFVHQREVPPLVTIQEPRNGFVARQSSLRLKASCVDPGQSCALRVTVQDAKGNSSEVATADRAIDRDVSLGNNEGGRVTLVVTGRNDAGQTATDSRIIFFEGASPALTEVDHVEGSILDVDPNRILSLNILLNQHLFGAEEIDDPSTEGIGHIFNRSSRTDETIDGATVTAFERPWVPGAYLSPSGAILMNGENRATRVNEWRGGTLTDLGAVWSYSLAVSGYYAIWSDEGGTLVRRDLLGGTSVTVTTTAAPNDNGVGANGDVVYWTAPGYEIYRYRAGTTTQLTNDTDRWNVYPLTDGVNVVYRKGTPCCESQTYAIERHDGSAETELAPARAREPQPRQDYQVNNGWVAYTKADASGLQVWTRSPTGVERQVTHVLGGLGFHAIESLGPGGEVVFFDGRRYLARPDYTAPIQVGSMLGRAIWVGGELHLVIGNTLLRFNR